MTKEELIKTIEALPEMQHLAQLLRTYKFSQEEIDFYETLIKKPGDKK